MVKYICPAFWRNRRKVKETFEHLANYFSTKEPASDKSLGVELGRCLFCTKKSKIVAS